MARKCLRRLGIQSLTDKYLHAAQHFSQFGRALAPVNRLANGFPAAPSFSCTKSEACWRT